jgi:hypothetical protein
MPENQGFFDRPPIQQTPNPEPPGFDLLRDMLMRRAFELNANPYGLSPNYQGPSPWQPGGRGAFNPYTGGYGGPRMGGGMGMGDGMGSGGGGSMGPLGRPPGGNRSGPGAGAGGRMTPLGSGGSLSGMMGRMGGRRPMARGRGGPGVPGGPRFGGGGRGMRETPNEVPQSPGGGSMNWRPTQRRSFAATGGMDAEPSYDGAVGVRGGFVNDMGFTPWAAGPGMRMAGPEMMGPAMGMGMGMGPGGGLGGFARGSIGTRPRRRPVRRGYEGQTAVGVRGGYSTQGPGGSGFVPWNADRYRGGATPPDPQPFGGEEISPLGGGGAGLQTGLGGGPPEFDSDPRRSPLLSGSPGGTGWWQSFPEWQNLQFPPGDPRNATGGQGPGVVGRPPGAGGPPPAEEENPDYAGPGPGRRGYGATSLPVKLAMGMGRRGYQAAPVAPAAAPRGPVIPTGGGPGSSTTTLARPETPTGTVEPRSGNPPTQTPTRPTGGGGQGGPYTPDGRVRDFFGNVRGPDKGKATNYMWPLTDAYGWMEDALRGMGDNPNIAQRPSDANDQARRPTAGGGGGTPGQADQIPRP